MIFQEATHTRRLVGRLEEGEELVETWTDLCREHDVGAGRIEAIGALSEVEVARFDPDQGDYQTTYSGRDNFELISLDGNISTLGDAVVLRLECLLGVEGPAGTQLISGQLRSARAASVEFVVEIYDDLSMQRRLDADSGRLEMHTIERTEPSASTPSAQPAAKQSANQTTGQTAPGQSSAPPPAEQADDDAPIAGQQMSWKDAADQSSTPSSADASASKTGDDNNQNAQDLYADVDFDEALIEPGDILEHPKLGTCRIMKVEDGEFAHVRLPRGRIRKLSLDIVEVQFDREEDSRRIFKAIIRR